MNEDIIEVRNISKSFGGRKVVDDLSLSVNSGEDFRRGKTKAFCGSLSYRQSGNCFSR